MAADVDTSVGEVVADLDRRQSAAERRIDALLAELDEICGPLADAQVTVEELSARRLAITMELRKLGSHDKVTARHTGQKVGTVTQAIRKETLRQKGKPLTRRR